MPPQPIKSAVINKSVTKEQLKPFAKIRFELIRTYPNPACVTEATVDETEGEKKSKIKFLSKLGILYITLM